jgi:hypothetical protein
MQRTLALIIALAWATSTSATILIRDDETFAQVADGMTANIADLFDPQGTTAFASLPGVSSTTTSTFFTTGNSGIFSATFVQSRDGALNGGAYSAIEAAFTTDVNVPYTAVGTYWNSEGRGQLFSYLYDHTENSYPYLSDQVSVGASAAFTLGETEGNFDNDNSGSLTGMLLPGHAYQWHVQVFTDAYLAADRGANANGKVSLILGVVPENSSTIDLSLFLLTIGCTRWRAQSQLLSFGQSTASHRSGGSRLSAG